jgi:hypothetical protein
MDTRQSGTNPDSNPIHRPHSPMLDTPPDTRSPSSPVNSDEQLPTPHSHNHLAPQHQYTPTSPDSTTTSEWNKGPYLGPNLEAKASGSPLLHQTEQMGRERLSPTRSASFKEQQQQQQQQPNHFTPAFYTGTGHEKEDGYSSMMNGNGGAQPRRLYANTTPTSYTMPGAHPLTRTPTDSAQVDMPTPQGFYDSPAYWLILYFFFNLGLTLFNKIVLVSFPFPYVSSVNSANWPPKLTPQTLTGLHALSGCAGCYFALEKGAFVSLIGLSRADNRSPLVSLSVKHSFSPRSRFCIPSISPLAIYPFSSLPSL